MTLVQLIFLEALVAYDQAVAAVSWRWVGAALAVAIIVGGLAFTHYTLKERT
jgi:hypothetical protein